MVEVHRPVRTRRAEAAAARPDPASARAAPPRAPGRNPPLGPAVRRAASGGGPGAVRSSASPRRRRSRPAQAIIAPLSPQSGMVGGRSSARPRPRARPAPDESRRWPPRRLPPPGRSAGRRRSGRPERDPRAIDDDVDDRRLEAAQRSATSRSARGAIVSASSRTAVFRPDREKSGSRPPEHRPRQGKALGIARPRPCARPRPAGIGQTQQLATLSKASPMASSRVAPSRR